MISKPLFSHLKGNPQFDVFIRNTEFFEVLIKVIDQDEETRLSTEYPELLKSKSTEKNTKEQTGSKSLICLTFVKISLEVKNYEKLKKFKIYFDASKEKIIKILQN